MAEPTVRQAQEQRKTAETDVEVRLVVDGAGQSSIGTGVGFFDHLLTAFARTGLLDLQVRAVGDLEIDPHHTVEDVGVVLGRTLSRALGDRQGIRRYGWALVPMDDALARVVLDISGRPYLSWGVQLPLQQLGGFSTDLAEEFWRAVAVHAGWTLHMDVLRWHNAHHALESVWKAAGLAVRQAVERDPRIRGVLSTKGVLD